MDKRPCHKFLSILFYLEMTIFVSLIVGLLLFISPVLAQESPSPEAIREGLKSEIKNIRQNLREGVKEKRPEARERTSPSPTSEKDKTKAKEEIEAKKSKLKEKLQKVNEQKQKKVERISQQLDELNVRTTNHFSEVLDRLEKVLANVVSRVDKAEANNWDVSAVRAMIASAKEAIASAQSAIEAQKAKTYTPQITGEEAKLKVEVGEARKALHRDLAAVREKVKAAHEFVKAVAKALAQSPRIDQLNSPQKDE